MAGEIPDVENQKESLEHVVVVGAKGALGSRLVETFRNAGCAVTGADVVVEREEEVFADDGDDELYWRHLDATDAAAVERAVGGIEERVGAIDALVNCAGGFRWSHIDDVDDEDLDFLLDANLRSALLLTREVVPGMCDRGFGRIVYMSSKSTLNPGEGEGPYTSTKAGLNALTTAVAEEVKDVGDVTVNAILPSVIDTPQNREEMPDADVSKWVGRDQLARIIFRLTQSFGDPINGALLPGAGGM
jgi:NAD(P)-dependent dehydrogenase (short-subunit alcohol dehydrogenase family)